MKTSVLFLSLCVIHSTFLNSKVSACTLPLHATNGDIPAMPISVTNAYCQPKGPFKSLLLIRTAINVSDPVYRIIVLERDAANTLTGVKLLQFLSDGTPHPRQNNQDQDEIIFSRTGQNFEAKVKGIKTTISFSQLTFQFKIHRTIGGLSIRQHLNHKGRITVAGKETQLLLIQTASKKKWRWALNDGALVDFKSNRLKN